MGIFSDNYYSYAVSKSFTYLLNLIVIADGFENFQKSHKIHLTFSLIIINYLSIQICMI